MPKLGPEPSIDFVLSFITTYPFFVYLPNPPSLLILVHALVIDKFHQSTDLADGFSTVFPFPPLKPFFVRLHVLVAEVRVRFGTAFYRCPPKLLGLPLQVDAFR